VREWGRRRLGVLGGQYRFGFLVFGFEFRGGRMGLEVVAAASRRLFK